MCLYLYTATSVFATIQKFQYNGDVVAVAVAVRFGVSVNNIFVGTVGVVQNVINGQRERVRACIVRSVKFKRNLNNCLWRNSLISAAVDQIVNCY